MTMPSEDKSCHSLPPSEPITPSALVVKATVLRAEAAGVWLSTPVSTSCSGCQQQDNCSSGLVAKALPQRQQQLFLAGAVDLLPGQRVEISVEPGAVLHSALLVYLLPLLVFMATLALGHVQLWPELLQLAVALLSTTLTLWFVRRTERQRVDQLQVRLVRVLPEIALAQSSADGAPL